VYNIAIWLSFTAFFLIFFYPNLSFIPGYHISLLLGFISYEICVLRVDLFSAHDLETGGVGGCY